MKKFLKNKIINLTNLSTKKITTKNRYLQCTSNRIRLLTDTGTPFDAIQRYAPICNLLTLLIVMLSPSYISALIFKISFQITKKFNQNFGFQVKY